MRNKMLSVENTNINLYKNDSQGGITKTTTNKSDVCIFEEANNTSKSVSFFSDDWSAHMARKLGMNNFADWIDNKEALENPEKVKQESFLSKTLRAMVKHPVITALSIAGIVIGGRAIYKYIKNKPNIAVNKPTVEVNQTISTQKVTEAVQKAPQLEATPENIKKLNETVLSGVNHQHSIGYADFDALKHLSADERQNLTRYFDTYSEQKVELASFLAGEKPAFISGKSTYSSNLLNTLNSDKIMVKNFLWDDNASIIMNKKAVSEIISSNKDLFETRLGLPKECTIKDIEDLMFKFTLKSPLTKKDSYEDLLMLLCGQEKYNAIHCQIIKDIKKLRTTFHPCHVDTLEEYKNLLKKTLGSKSSSYLKMDQSFIDEMGRQIDALQQSSFDRIALKYREIFKSSQADTKEFESLVRLANKLENARVNGTAIKMN